MSKSMSPEEINEILKAKGLSHAKVARRLRPPVTKQMVTAAINRRGIQKSERVRRAIARAIERPYDEVFPAA